MELLGQGEEERGHATNQTTNKFPRVGSGWLWKPLRAFRDADSVVGQSRRGHRDIWIFISTPGGYSRMGLQL